MADSEIWPASKERQPDPICLFAIEFSYFTITFLFWFTYLLQIRHHLLSDNEYFQHEQYYTFQIKSQVFDERFSKYFIDKKFFCDNVWVWIKQNTSVQYVKSL